ncbi:oleoyl-[acyl-carrier-protein] hydrolase [Caerostris extrusa]|uniref:oleoyl-[acyl-carrier-protein] hydrolase n=1 Tax=Caerostris extrusa TaxID=172846 RepID=A0AAV4VC17_CAEEX|nr:oleoyl-[acyl-carrier-protein] hydrolase [Caerostris extrusa]
MGEFGIDSIIGVEIKQLIESYTDVPLIQSTTAGPFHVVGHSLGGCIAFEMAIQSEKRKQKLKSVSLLSGSEDLINILNKEEVDGDDPEVTALCKFVEQFAFELFPGWKKNY